MILPTEEKALSVRDRLCRLMGWAPSTSHKFEIIRRTMSGDAIALGLDKANELADRLELNADVHSVLEWAWQHPDAPSAIHDKAARALDKPSLAHGHADDIPPARHT